MSGSSPVFHSEDVGLEFLQPPGHLSFRLFEGHEPLESRVVGPHCKRQAAEVVPEVTDGEHYDQELSAGNAVTPLRLVKGPAKVRHHSLSIRPYLGEHPSHPDATSIGVQHERQRGVSWG